MIDIHSHILPGIDDGAKDIDMTINMICNSIDNKVNKLIATPHYCLGYGEVEYREVEDMVSNLNCLLNKKHLDVTIYPGQEVYFNSRLVEWYKEKRIGTLNNTRYMLIELPIKSFDYDTLDVLYELKVIGITPVLAHPERYYPIINNPMEINKFIDEEILFQVNSGSLSGKFGEKVKKTANILMKNNIYSFIGSDAHNDVNRTTSISKDIEIANKNLNINKQFFNDNSERLLLNKDVEFCGEKITKKSGLFNIFRRK